MTDAAGMSATQTVAFQIDNVAPTVNAGPDQTATEGSPVTLHGSFFDPGVQDPHTLSWSYSSTNGQMGSGSGDTFNFTPLDNGTYTVTFTVADDHTSASDSATVTVLNAAPVANAGLDQTVNEGQAVMLTGNFTDAGPLDTHTFDWHVVSNNGQTIADGHAQTFGFTAALPRHVHGYIHGDGQRPRVEFVGRRGDGEQCGADDQRRAGSYGVRRNADHLDRHRHRSGQ